MFLKVRLGVYEGCQRLSDWLRTPFNYWYSKTDSVVVRVLKGLIVTPSLVLSLIPRKIAIWSNPNSFKHTKTSVVPVQTTKKVKVLSYNILGFHNAQVVGQEYQRSWKERFDEFSKVIDDSDADIVLIQESFSGSDLEKRLIERFKNKYSDFWGDIGAKACFFSSGLFVMSRLKNCSLESFQRYSTHLGTGKFFMNKGFAVMAIKDDRNKVVMRVANTHLQHGSNQQAFDAREQQVRQLMTHLEEQSPKGKEVLSVIGGDLNVNRLNQAEWLRSSLNPLNNSKVRVDPQFDYKLPTQADLNEDGSIKTVEAVDNILIANSSLKPSIRLRTVSEFRGRNAPSDHSALLATLDGQYS
jgi:endonuclease/exonuclease/phosphatase family metal-dependent hydrolase